MTALNSFWEEGTTPQERPKEAKATLVSDGKCRGFDARLRYLGVRWVVGRCWGC